MSLEQSGTCRKVHRDAKVVLESCSNFQMACGKLLETGVPGALLRPTTMALVLLHDLVEHWVASKLPETCRWLSREGRTVLETSGSPWVVHCRLVNLGVQSGALESTPMALVLVHGLVKNKTVPGHSWLSTVMPEVQMTALHGPGAAWACLETSGVLGLNPVAPGWSHDFSYVTR